MIEKPYRGAVDSLFEISERVSDVLRSSASDSSEFEDLSRKISLLAAASWLESAMTHALHEGFVQASESLGEFVRRHAIERKFYTWFDFDKPLPERLFRSFGDETFARYQAALDGDRDFEEGCKAFMRICSARNILIHGNLADQKSDLTTSDVKRLFNPASHFPSAAAKIIFD